MTPPGKTITFTDIISQAVVIRQEADGSLAATLHCLMIGDGDALVRSTNLPLTPAEQTVLKQQEGL